MKNNALSYYTKLLVGITFLLVIAGGLVTSTKSGLSVPDWPLSYGQLMPPMVGGIRFEHTHRLIASLVGFMTLVLAVWLIFSEPRKWVRRIGIAALGLVVAQGILGGMTVLYLLPAPISILHACIAQTFFSVTVSIAFIFSKEWHETASLGRVFSKQPFLLMVIMIYVQLILGATLRHTGNQLVAVSHAIWGFVVLIHASVLMNRVMINHQGEKKLVRPALFLGIITLLQLILGMGAYIYQYMVPGSVNLDPGKIFFITAHQTLGALVLATSVFLALRVFRKTVNT